MSKTIGQQIKDTSSESLNKKRTKYPFDESDCEESYFSEYEENDPEDVTKGRRVEKDKVEHGNRDTDKLEGTIFKSDQTFVEPFQQFKKDKSSEGEKSEGYTQQREVSTIKMYTRAVEHDILGAFHRCVKPFKAEWILDPITPKYCKFNGEDRSYIKP